VVRRRGAEVAEEFRERRGMVEHGKGMRKDSGFSELDAW
jgi:hypothetical protein